MFKINKIDGEVRFDIGDDLYICARLYNAEERIFLYSFNSTNRSIYYRNSTFFSLQSQAEELKKANEQIALDASCESEYCRDFMAVSQVLNIYSKLVKPACSLWIGDKSRLSLMIENIIRKFHADNRLLYINDLNLLSHLSSFACIFLDELYFFHTEIELLNKKLLSSGELIVLGDDRMDFVCVNLTTKNADAVECEAWSFDNREYFISLKPKEYELFCDNYAAKKKVCVEIRKLLFPVLDALLTVDVKSDISRINECIKALEKAADVAAEISSTLNDENLGFKILDLQNALLDFKYQKELFGSEDINYYLGEIMQKKAAISEFLSKEIYEM